MIFTDISIVRVGNSLDIEIHIFNEIIKNEHMKLSIFSIEEKLRAAQAK